MKKDGYVILRYIDLNNIAKGCNEAGLNGKHVNNIVIVLRDPETKLGSSIIIGADHLENPPKDMPDVEISIVNLENAENRMMK